MINSPTFPKGEGTALDKINYREFKIKNYD